MPRPAEKPLHSVTLRGLTYTAFIGADGPYITLREDRYTSHVSLGSCTTLERRPADSRGPAGLWIAKYRTQKRVPVPDLRPDELDQLADGFGLPLQTGQERYDPVLAFYRSDTARGLIAWVERHPRVAARLGRHESYVGDWYGWCRHTAAAERIVDAVRR